MLFPTVKCPFCGGLMPNDRYASRGPWTCPACNKDLRIPRWYLRLLSWCTLGISFALCFVLGLRGFQFFVALLLSSFPMYFMLRYMVNLAAPTPLELYPTPDLNSYNSTPPAPPLLRVPPFKCPFCHTTFTSTFKRNQPITCPTCAHQLMTARWYEHTIFLSAIGLTWMLCVLLGLHNWWLGFGIVLFWFPVMLAWMMFLGQISSTPLQTYEVPNQRMIRSKSIRCPMCEEQFPLPLRWSHPPFHCPSCHEQLQATVKFELLLRYLLVVAITPICFLSLDK